MLTPLLLSMARAARDISLPRFRTGLAADIKPDHSPVTEIDRAVETRLHAFLPEAEKLLQASVGFVGEEHGTINEDAEFLFVLDPIDGTKQYLTNSSEWFTLIGVHQRGHGFIAGMVDQPDADRAWAAERNNGAHIYNRTQLQTSTPLPRVPHRAMAQSVLMSYDPFMLPPAHRALYDKLRAAAPISTLSGAAGSFMRIAEGAGQVVLESVGGIYDIAAVLPILAECGAVLTGLNNDGTPFTPDLNNFTTRSTVLACASEKLCNEILTSLSS